MPKKSQEQKEEELRLATLEQKVLDKILTLIMSALGFVAALAWNDAIQTTFKKVLGEHNQLWGKYIYALILTIIVVIVSIQLDRTLKKLRKEQEEKQKKENNN